MVNQEEEMKIEDIPIARDFVDVFLEDLPRLPPDKEMEFSIKLIESSKPISWHHITCH